MLAMEFKWNGIGSFLIQPYDANYLHLGPWLKLLRLKTPCYRPRTGAINASKATLGVRLRRRMQSGGPLV
ncbi:hypothetical protein CGMCC3_g14918 [Colletotrichum fructicola]|nr:uncharacterized protein CGMCC3_g14918 [Colletotrichum fructicola]KAE9568899.1 hypothetical protein CGMCC3_g14918 [Colletotrichum fructicola]